MKKIKFEKWFSILPGFFIFVIALFLWFLSGLKRELILPLLLSLMLFIYYLTFFYSDKLFDFGLLKLRNDKRILQLDKEHIVFTLALLNGFGIALLIPGLSIFHSSPTMATFGFVLIIIANIAYNIEYLPRQILLKIGAEIDYAKKKNL